MTPKEKAKDLFDKMYNSGDLTTYSAKKCALKAVYEAQQLIKDLSSCKYRFIYIVDEMNYWHKVEKELNNIIL